MNRKTIGREGWSYHSCQIPGQSGHFVWGKDLALSRLGISRQRNKASENSVAVWKSCNTLFFHYCGFYKVLILFSACHGSLAHQTHSYQFIINHMIHPGISQETTYFLQVLESWLFGDMRFLSGSDLRH